MHPLDYVRKGLRNPEHRSLVERRLDRIFLALILPIVVAVFGIILLLLISFVATLIVGDDWLRIR